MGPTEVPYDTQRAWLGGPGFADRPPTRRPLGRHAWPDARRERRERRPTARRRCPAARRPAAWHVQRRARAGIPPENRRPNAIEAHRFSQPRGDRRGRPVSSADTRRRYVTGSSARASSSRGGGASQNLHWHLSLEPGQGQSCPQPALVTGTMPWEPRRPTPNDSPSVWCTPLSSRSSPNASLTVSKTATLDRQPVRPGLPGPTKWHRGRDRGRRLAAYSRVRTDRAPARIYGRRYWWGFTSAGG